MKELLEHDIILERGEIFACGDIDDDFYVQLMKNISIMEHAKKGPITIYLNSQGGDPTLALGLYDRILNCSYVINIHVYGEVCSSANIILQAADKRVMSKHSVMMLHDISIETGGHIKSVDNIIKMTKIQSNYITDILTQKLRISRAQFQRKMLHDWYLTSSEALELGLIDERA